MEKQKPISQQSRQGGQIVPLQKGKIPPQAIDLEEAVLGAMLIDEKGVNEVIDILSPDVFYKKAHQLIFESIQRLFRESEPIDLLTVSADLKKNKNFEIVGGDFYLIGLGLRRYRHLSVFGKTIDGQSCSQKSGCSKSKRSNKRFE